MVCIPGFKPAIPDCWSAFWEINRQRPFDDLFSAMQINNAGMRACIFDLMVYFPESSLNVSGC